MASRSLNVVFLRCSQAPVCDAEYFRPSEDDVLPLLERADVILVELQALPLVGVHRRSLFQILHSKTSIVLYPRYRSPDYDQIRMAYRSGASDVLPMPDRLSELILGPSQCLQTIETRFLDRR